MYLSITDVHTAEQNQGKGLTYPMPVVWAIRRSIDSTGSNWDAGVEQIWVLLELAAKHSGPGLGMIGVEPSSVVLIPET